MVGCCSETLWVLSCSFCDCCVARMVYGHLLLCCCRGADIDMHSLLLLFSQCFIVKSSLGYVLVLVLNEGCCNVNEKGYSLIRFFESTLVYCDVHFV